MASGWTVVLAETGNLSVRVEGAVWITSVIATTQTDAPLNAGEQLLIPPGSRYVVRNDGPTMVQALVVTLVAAEGTAPPQTEWSGD
jgi:hypothetical protein